MEPRTRRRVRRTRRKTFPVLTTVGLVAILLAVAGWYYRQELATLYGQASEWIALRYGRSPVANSGAIPPPLEEKIPKQRSGKVRGDIYDRNFKVLAQTLDRVSVYVRPHELEDIYLAAGQLAAIFGLNEQELTEHLATDAQRVWVVKNISVEEEKTLKDLHMPGVYLHREDVRYYPYKGVAAHVLGYADHNMGLAGTEHFYNRLLDQVSIGQEDFPQIDLEGRSRTAVDGQHLVLTIDLKIQDYLEKYATSLEAVSGGSEVACLLMETDSGAVVANAHTPTFDPNLYYQYGQGSLNDIFAEPMVIPEDIRHFFQNAAMLQTESEGLQPELPWSVKAGTADPGVQVRLWEKMGLGTSPKLDFSMTDKQKQAGTEGQLLMLPQGENGMLPLQASPLQMLMGLVYLINGGHQVTPHVCGRILERSGEHEFFYKPPAMNKVGIDDHPGTAEIRSLLKAGRPQGPLESVFVSSSGLSLFSDPRGGRYQRSRIMFTVLPADKPELVLLTLVRKPYLEPSPPPTGNTLDLATPLEKMLPVMVALQQVHKNLSDMMTVAEKKASNYQQDLAKEKKKQQSDLQTIVAQHKLLMPDMVGLSLRRALRQLQDTQVKVRVQGTGRVVAQTPVAGTSLDHVKECQLSLQRDEKDPLRETPQKKGPIAMKGDREIKKKGKVLETRKGAARAN